MDNNFISLNEYKTITKTKDTAKLNKMKFFATPNLAPKADVVELRAKLEDARRQNGLIEKLADKIKNKTKIGYGSKKIEQLIQDIENGNGKSQQEVEKEIKNYRRSQESTAQTVADVASVLATAAVFFATRNMLIKGKAIGEINFEKNKDLINKFLKRAGKEFSGKIEALNLKPKQAQKLTKFLENIQKSEYQEELFNKLTSTKTINTLTALQAMGLGFILKKDMLKLNRLGTKQYKADINKETMSKKEIKQAKKASRREKRGANFRNGLSGAINGFAMASIGILGPVAVPFYIVANSLNKYFIASREDKGEKSITSYVDNLKASKITNALGAAAMAIPLAKSGKYSKVLEKNAKIVSEQLQKAKLENVDSGKTTYQELEEILFSDEDIKGIINNSYNFQKQEDLQNSITQLRNKNIFAVKFKQIANDGSSLTNTLKENCPQTWTLEQAQAQVEKTYGANKYKLKKCVGTGTVAQTFVAQDEKGNNVCIKLIHQGIDKEKIAKDKESFIALINSTQKSQQEKDFLIKNVENLASGIEKEIDLNNELEAAKKLAQTTKMANVVKPIEVKDNIYVMERADGISVKDFNDFGTRFDWANWDVNYYEKQLKENPTDEFYIKRLKEAKENLEKLKTEFKDKIGIDFVFDDLSKEETIKMIEAYQDVLNEQFSKVDAQGKVIHGDIHPGNIFIDVKKLKAGDNKYFTLIDTGNTIEQTSEQALRFMNLTKYIKNADVDNITDFVLEGAALPQGMTMEKAKEIISAELNKVFFDDKTNIGIMTNDSLMALTDNIMKKADIIPSNTQASLSKAKQSSSNSLTELMEAYMKKFEEKANARSSATNTRAEAVAAGLKSAAELSADVARMNSKDKIKKLVIERSNLKQMTPSQRLNIKKGKNTPKSNSKEALTYKFKQFTFDLKDKFRGVDLEALEKAEAEK